MRGVYMENKTHAVIELAVHWAVISFYPKVFGSSKNLFFEKKFLAAGGTSPPPPPYGFQLSFKETVRLNTGFSGVCSRSAAK